MNLIYDCPECGKVLSAKLKCCSCGWMMKEQHNEDNAYQCQFQVRDMRCENVGTICRSVKGTSRKWYCSKHWYDVSNLKK